MAEAPSFLTHKRYAVVTGSNKGLGLEISRQLASQGVVVLLTSRDEKRGLEAIEQLKNSGVNSENLEYHQLDVTDPPSFAALIDFIKAKFGKLDILVNNAGVNGVIVNFTALLEAIRTQGAQINYDGVMKQTYELAEECLQTNYYGVKRTINALLPLLQLSDSPRIVNISSDVGLLKKIPGDRIRQALGDVEKLTEEQLDKILEEFLTDFKEGTIAEKGWPTFKSAYSMSKAALNSYTRILSPKYPSIIINCVCPGVVKTDINCKMGHLTVEEGAIGPVRLALVPHGSPSGLFYTRNEVTSFE
ncbi:(+)-neomenthol dehydrogenase-like [Silene latifolia]|uniref:(+)-neomenthol dehydrogenase-like n=1 Tax=Silene latifolia TaxID=37657 RepID=UPI003D774FE7